MEQVIFFPLSSFFPIEILTFEYERRFFFVFAGIPNEWTHMLWFQFKFINGKYSYKILNIEFNTYVDADGQSLKKRCSSEHWHRHTVSQSVSRDVFCYSMYLFYKRFVCIGGVIVIFNRCSRVNWQLNSNRFIRVWIHFSVAKWFFCSKFTIFVSRIFVSVC